MYTFFSYTDDLLANCGIHPNEFGSKAICFQEIASIVSRKANEVMCTPVTDPKAAKSASFFEASNSGNRVKCIWTVWEDDQYVQHTRFFQPVEIIVPVNTDNVELTSDQMKEKVKMRNRIIAHFKKEENKRKIVDNLIFPVDDLNMPENERNYRVWKIATYSNKALTLLQNILTCEFIVVDINNWSYKMLKAMCDKNEI